MEKDDFKSYEQVDFVMGFSLSCGDFSNFFNVVIMLLKLGRFAGSLLPQNPNFV